MKTILIFFVQVGLLVQTSCSSDNSDDHQTNTSDTIIANTSQTDTLYKDNNTLIIRTDNSVDTFLKFIPHIDDSIYFVKSQDIKLTKKLDFSKYEYKKLYITRTKEGVQEQGVNFAGHFCFVYWGCGSPCKVSAVVDVRTGIVYNGVPSAIGYSFKKDSKILIIDPPDSSNWYFKDTHWEPTEFLWTGKAFEKL